MRCKCFDAAISHALAKVFEGVCTTYMQQLAVGSSVDVFLRVSKFKLPKQLNSPVIMIGESMLVLRGQFSFV